MKEYNKPYILDEEILIEDIVMGSQITENDEGTIDDENGISL